MRLPRLPNGFMKSRARTVQFLGVNLTENYTDGEMFDCKNLSTLQYPTLSQRKGRAVLTGYSDAVTDLYEWDGHLIVVDNGILCVDGDPIASVNAERKQFAVVNSKLIVFPDKISVDLKNNEYTKLDDYVVSPTGYPQSKKSFTHNSITAYIDHYVYAGARTSFSHHDSTNSKAVLFYTYGDDMDAVRECWDASTKTWDTSALDELKTIWTNSSYGKEYVSDAVVIFSSGSTPRDPHGHIYIPEFSGFSAYNLVGGQVLNGEVTYPDTSKYNAKGLVGVIKGQSVIHSGAHDFEYAAEANIIDVSVSKTKFSDVFNIGDMIEISGTPYGLLDTTGAKIKITGFAEASDLTKSVIQFADNTFRLPYGLVNVASTVEAGDYYISVKQSFDSSNYYYYTFSSSKSIQKDLKLVIYGTNSEQEIYLWDPEKKSVVDTFTGTRETTEPSGVTSIGTMTGYNADGSTVTIRRAIPDLDFICERDNRLWGVSNDDNTIYCSALGIPWDFYDYNGLDTGSYAVAVGSAGDFTGIVSYGGVLCFKENKLHKMLGSFPSDFYMTTYDIAGIAKNAERSAVIISEVLYYRAPLGVMAFTGYQPTNISPNLALENTTGGVAGTNGREYFICVQAKEGTDHYTLFKYDMQYKLWIKEDDVNVTSTANINGNMCINVQTKTQTVIDGQTQTIIRNTPYITGQQNEEGMNVDWFAQFLPFSDSMAANGIRKVGYSRIILRFDMAPGALFTVKVREDDGQWKQAWSQVATHKLAHTVPLRIGRCDKFEIRLEGTGQTKIRAMEREFVQGGWYDGSNFY